MLESSAYQEYVRRYLGTVLVHHKHVSPLSLRSAEDSGKDLNG